ncbi:MAG: hypothetical protein IKY59_07585 [Oscillospiraceae bacterium]|nr:hypothetical protein [Oscillospiraceae bacterium]
MSKKTFLILTCIVVAITIAVVAAYLVDNKMPGNTVTEYNAYATQKAWADGSIRENEILILKSVSRSNGNAMAEFHIYTMPVGADAAKYLGLKVSEVTDDAPLVLMGNASCVFFGDQLSNISSISTLYLR